tara:strand:+ start:1666 stop:2349 length:684 start_codon:yes stop_codon:yes gene_type:complete
MINLPKKVLIFAAHQDDETIGCGGTIKLMSNSGSKVHICFMTNGETGIEQNSDGSNITQTRMKEAKLAGKVLGAFEVSSFDIACQQLSNDITTFHKVIKKIRTVKPELVITHSNICKHRDHKITTDIVQEACWKASENILDQLGKVHTVSDLWSFEILDLHQNPDFVINISETYKSKIEAMNVYLSQTGILNDITSFIDGLSKVRGYSINVNRGEAFTRLSRTPIQI